MYFNANYQEWQDPHQSFYGGFGGQEIFPDDTGPVALATADVTPVPLPGAAPLLGAALALLAGLGLLRRRGA